MANTPLQHPDRFQDPLGDHMQAAALARTRHLERYPQVDEVYRGFYLRFTPQSERGKGFLGGAEGIIGTELFLAPSGTGLRFVTRNGDDIDALGALDSERFTAFLEQGWVVRCVLAFSIYSMTEKAFAGEIACFCLSPTLSDDVRAAIETFIDNIADRVGGASYPELTLTQTQFVKVIESNGAWYLTKDMPYPKLPKGTLYHRRRKSINDRLVAQALKGNKGCLVASWVGFFVVIAAIGWLVWWFFSR